MGKQISKYEYQKHGSCGLMKPIIFCGHNKELEKNAIALNVGIAGKLINAEPSRRSFKLPSIINTIIAEIPENSAIKDFDVLFNPDYHPADSCPSDG